MKQQLPFLEIMKLPMSVGNAVIEGGQIGIKGGDPLLATAKKLEKAFTQPLAMLSIGGQPPQLVPVFEQFKILSPIEVLETLKVGGEIVGEKATKSGHQDVMTSIY